MKNIFVVLLTSILPSIVFSQNKEQKFGIDFSGFVKNDFFWDSRQNVSLREGHFLLYPSPVSADAEGNDINAKSNFNFLSIQSRLTGKISGPDAFKAKTSGVIEADFFGNENTNFSDVNGFRLRHAYAKLNWKKTELLFGQTWHPMFIAGCYPGVVSFNTGSPFQPFSRNPQAKFTYKFGKINVVASANSQRDFASPGGSSVTLRNSAIPEMHAQIIYGTKNDSLKKEFLIGIGGGYKTLVPRLYSEVITTPEKYILDTATNTVTHTYAVTTKYKTDEKVGGYTAYGFMKYKIPALTFKLYGVYGQNLFDMTMLGGYAVCGITDLQKDFKDYVSYNIFSTWAEIQTNGKRVQAGLFAGFTQNRGADKKIISYSLPAAIPVASNPYPITTAAINRGADIKSIYRIAPRLIFISEKFQFMTELEYTSAAYATKNASGTLNRDEKGVITDADYVSNIRFLFAVQYNF
ncbi:MAG TPA: hypothetical protein PKK00_04910 [Bacteroidales bacterium]|nr:hypothetical protein [Bacteroidales bacterium]HPS16806.1 hypothetical protein [Bacteroidales bacterium]